ncbi:MAG: methylated-DNA--[protein]-cysteine S-methyltransferase [Chloroflexi bacterium]|nr:methylated-DNA--[protein]-cysteine S-methyltransferase [Chloroflexota bacterium]
MPDHKPESANDMTDSIQDYLQNGPRPELAEQAHVRLLARLDAELPPRAYYDNVPNTLIGDVWVAASDQGLVLIDFDISETALLAVLTKGQRYRPVRDARRVDPYRLAVSEYLMGRRQRLDLPVDLRSLSPFQRSVLLAAREVPRGQVTTYADIAQRIGKPRAFRAVGQALRNNPVPIVIPCHRIVNSDGTLGGYGGVLGSQRKLDLLKLEGVALVG